MPPKMEAIDNDSDFEEETLWERITALEEAVPESIKTVVATSASAVKTLFTGGKQVAWFVTSTAAILVLPISLELERQEYLEQVKRQERDILLGPA